MAKAVRHEKIACQHHLLSEAVRAVPIARESHGSARKLSWLVTLLTSAPMTLAEGLGSRQDNFLLLRMIAASLVIYGHARAITGGTSPSDFIQRLGWRTYSGEIALHMFFVTSGFLVVGSFVRTPAPWRFVTARVLRIVPAYAVCIVLSACILGLVNTALSPAQYLSDPLTWHYITNNMTFDTLQYNLPGTFADNPKQTAFNGSLWTLPVEVRMYAYVLGLGVFGLLSRRWIGNASLLVLCVAGIVAAGTLPGVAEPERWPLAGMFALGGLAYLNRGSIPASGRLVLVLGCAAWALHATLLYKYSLALALASFVFWFAYRIPWRGYNRFGDYSYGTYLWGWPVQQTLAHFFPQLHSLFHTLIALPIAIVLGILSWQLVERPAIALGRRWCRSTADIAPLT
jgi:peptidoglycan/LPS O-acetylase OafA/YrhL